MFKNLIATFVLIMVLLASCEKMTPYHEDGSEITAAEAVELVKPIIQKYAEEGRFWLISKNPISPHTTLRYGPLGIYYPGSNYTGSFKSPNYKAWLLVIRPDMRINGSPYESLCLFINVSTGKYTEVTIDGEPSGIEWDDSFFINTDVSLLSKSSESLPEQKHSRSLSNSTSGLYAVIISGGESINSNFSRYWNDCQYVSFYDPWGNLLDVSRVIDF